MASAFEIGEVSCGSTQGEEEVIDELILVAGALSVELAEHETLDDTGSEEFDDGISSAYFFDWVSPSGRVMAAPTMMDRQPQK